MASVSLQYPSIPTHSFNFRRCCSSSSSSSLLSTSYRTRRTVVSCSSSSHGSEKQGAKETERLLEEKRRAELAARIASGEFTVSQSGSVPLGSAGKLFQKFLSTFGFSGDKLMDGAKKIPQARGSVSAVGGQPFFKPLYDLFLAYGGLFRLTFGPKSFLIVSDPAMAKHILRENSKAYSKGILGELLEFVMGKGLIPADGEIWRVRRRAIVPALHQKYVAAMIGLFGEASSRLCEKLDTAASNGEDVEMESLFLRLALDIIGKAVFNYDFDSLTNDTGIVEAVYTLLQETERRSTSIIPTWDVPIWKNISPRQRKVREALQVVNTTLDDLIAICKGMVEKEELQFNEEYLNEQDPSILHFLLASGDDVSSKQLRDDLMTLLIAGHETSAAVLTWAFYLLVQNPKVMTKLQDEVDSVLGDRPPTIEDMPKLKYTTRVINEWFVGIETLPTTTSSNSRSLEDDVLGEYPIKRGEDIFISVWNIHRSPHHWADPETFNPERWPLDGPNPNEINQNFSYLPFGGGPRKCIGDMFATFENVVATAMLVRRFNFEMAPDAPPVEMTTGATIHTTEGLKMRVTRRMKPPFMSKLVPYSIAVDGNQELSSSTSTGATMNGDLHEEQQREVPISPM